MYMETSCDGWVLAKKKLHKTDVVTSRHNCHSVAPIKVLKTGQCNTTEEIKGTVSPDSDELQVQ
jgi:hypothetical protein